MKARKSASKSRTIKAIGKKIKVVAGKAPKKKVVRKGFEKSRALTVKNLQKLADYQYALMQIRDLEPVAEPGLTVKRGASLQVAQDIATRALEG